MTAVSLLSFGGDQGCQLWSFWVLVVILPHASLSLPALWFYSVTLSCWTACVPRSKYKGSCSCDWKQLPFSQGGKKKLLSLSAFKVWFGSREVQVSRASGRRGVWVYVSVLRFSLCMADVAESQLHSSIRAAAWGVWSHTSLGVSSIWKCKQYLLD